MNERLKNVYLEALARQEPWALTLKLDEDEAREEIRETLDLEMKSLYETALNVMCDARVMSEMLRNKEEGVKIQ